MEIQLNDTMKLPSGKERSMFDTAIPGQSLTKTPNLYPWDKPPMLNTPDEAMNYFIDKFDNDANAEKLLSLIDSQIPVSVIADSLLLAGFTRLGIGKSFIHVDNCPKRTAHRIWTYEY